MALLYKGLCDSFGQNSVLKTTLWGPLVIDVMASLYMGTLLSMPLTLPISFGAVRLGQILGIETHWAAYDVAEKLNMSRSFGGAFVKASQLCSYLAPVACAFAFNHAVIRDNVNPLWDFNSDEKNKTSQLQQTRPLLAQQPSQFLPCQS